MSDNRYWAAWDSLMPEMLDLSFRNCGVSNTMDGTDKSAIMMPLPLVRHFLCEKYLIEEWCCCLRILRVNKALNLKFPPKKSSASYACSPWVEPLLLVLPPGVLQFSFVATRQNCAGVINLIIINFHLSGLRAYFTLTQWLQKQHGGFQ